MDPASPLVEVVHVDDDLSLRCAEPAEIVDMGVAVITSGPLTGVCERSQAITDAAPRRNTNGDAAIRPILSGTSSATRPAFPASTTSTGLGRFFGGVH
jgi:hypothetical protein